ncbi:MAG: dihydrodipicolinate synthase family protein, partial [Desulfobacterales bacterium]
MTKKVCGVFAPISTPFIDDEVSYDRFKENIKKYSQTPLNGYLVLGSNGESKSLTEDEKLKLLEIVLQEKAAHQLVMAGTGYESTRQTIAFSKRAQALGADLVSLVSPSYFKKSLTDDALIGYYTQVAEALSIPVFAYNAPGFTGLTISAAVIETISQHPNIGGMKDT